MRTKLMIMVAALLLVSAGAKAQDASGSGQAANQPAAQQDVPKQPVPAVGTEFELANQADFVVRGTNYATGSDQARYQRFRDLRDGGTLDVFRFSKATDAYLFQASADHVGYRDQRYSAQYNDYGKVKAAFTFDSIPLFYSQTTQTMYNQSGGVLSLADGIQSGIQNKTLTSAQAVSGFASPFDLYSKRQVADFALTYSTSKYSDLIVTFKNTNRNGNQPFGATFGFSDAVEVPVPLDNRTTDMGAAIEIGNDHGFMRVAYDGSFFRNNVGSLVWDNPQRVSNAAFVNNSSAPVMGQMALWPNTDSNTASATGTLNLAGRSHLTAFLSIGELTNNDPLLPVTVNAAIPAVTLPRSTADVKALVTAMNFNFTSRPADKVWFSARYRGYKFDNQTSPFFLAQNVQYDTSLNTAFNEAAEPIGYSRHTADGDVTITPNRFIALRGGYTLEQIDYTGRYADSTTEDIGRLSVDATGISWLMLRGVYEHGKRTANNVDLNVLTDLGEQTGLRQYDIGDRNRDRFSAIAQLMPVSEFSINGTVATGRDEYLGGYFGLQNLKNDIYSIGFDYVPQDKVSFGLTYGYEKNTGFQVSRTANPYSIDKPPYQFDNPNRDWTDSTADKTNDLDVSLDLLKAIPKTEIRIGYNYNRGESTYSYGVGPGWPLAAPVPLAPVTNELQRGTVDFRYFLTRHLAAGFVYWYDKYSVSDFALGPQAVNSIGQPSFLMLGYFYQPYTANTVWGRLTYLW